mgnify:CR=1 FL=1
MSGPGVRRFESREALDAALAGRIATALAQPGAGAIMLSGGSTPLAAYRRLAAGPLPHAATLRVLYSDDRHVAPDSPQSNYHQSRALIDALRLPESGVLRIPTEQPLEQAALAYDASLRGLLREGVPLRFGVLGLGADGHTASLFTTADLERSAGRMAVTVQRPDGLGGISVTPGFLAQFDQIVFAVAGPGKRVALGRLLAGDAALVAWRAVSGCRSVQVWCEPAAEA